MSKWARPVLLTVLLALPACTGGGAAPPPEQQAAYAETAPPVGQSVQFFMYTHCGVETAQIGGRLWQAVEPLYGEGGEGVNPPPGWDNPYQEGTLLMQSPSRAVFRANGTNVVLVPAPSGRSPRPCM